MAFPWDAVIDAGANILGNILGWFSNKNTNSSNSQQVAQTNATNLQIAQNTNAMNQAINESNIRFQQAENEIARQREDNAVRRRANDLVGAGLSKTLAAGSPAAANAMQAPQATIGMETGHAMQAARSNAYNPNIQTNFETAMNHQKQNEIADKEADAALLNAQTAADRAKAESEHWSNQDEETRRHNEVVESQNEQYHDLQDQWHKAELDQNSVFHDDAMTLANAELQLKEIDYLNTWDQMEIQNEYYKAQTELQKATTNEMAARLTADLAESAARVGLYLEQTRLTTQEITEVKANVKEIVARTAYIVAEKYHLNAQTKQTVANTLTTIYNLLLARSEHTTTTGTVVGESAAAQNKANRHTELASKALGVTGTILGVGLGAFIGGAPARAKRKMMDAESLAGMGIFPW